MSIKDITQLIAILSREDNQDNKWLIEYYQNAITKIINNAFNEVLK
jgi:hypothetical protein